MNALRRLWSPEQHLKTQKRLNFMSRRGPIFDYKEVMSTNGKVWTTPASLISSFDAKQVPDSLQIHGKPARHFFNQSRASLLTVSYAAFSDSAVTSFTTHFPQLPSLLFRPILNPLKWLLWSRLIPSTAHSVVLRGDLPGAEEVFGMDNKAAAYIFLIDSTGLIRWKTAGPAQESELSSLTEAIKALERH